MTRNADFFLVLWDLYKHFSTYEKFYLVRFYELRFKKSCA